MKGIEKWSFFLLYMVLFSGILCADQVLPEILKPNSLAVDGNQIYIVQDVEVYIYSLADGKLKGKFGKKGEGPMEFLQTPELIVLKDSLFLSSMGKFAYFSKDGKFIREVKIANREIIKEPIPGTQNYIGQSFSRPLAGEKAFFSVNVYDAQVNKKNQVFKAPRSFIRDAGGFRVLENNLIFRLLNDKVITFVGNEFKINAVSLAGASVFTIQREYVPIKITSALKDSIMDYYKNHPFYGRRWERLKTNAVIPETFPAIREFKIADGKIYIRTFNKTKAGVEFFIYDAHGKFVKQLFLPLAEKEIMDMYPYDINGDELFQLIENEDEEWSLKRLPIK
jgi:hypothetical protein